MASDPLRVGDEIEFTVVAEKNTDTKFQVGCTEFDFKDFGDLILNMKPDSSDSNKWVIRLKAKVVQKNNYDHPCIVVGRSVVKASNVVGWAENLVITKKAPTKKMIELSEPEARAIRALSVRTGNHGLGEVFSDLGARLSDEFDLEDWQAMPEYKNSTVFSGTIRFDC